MYLNSLNEHLREKYGGKVYKLSLSSGCSCPNRDGTLGSRGCIFCDGAGAFAQQGELTGQIQAAKARLGNKVKADTRYIAYFQPFTNTYGDPERLYALYRTAIELPEIVGLSLATRPDCLPPAILTMLEKLNAVKPVWVELGLQTIHPESAAYIRRGYPLAVYDEAVRSLRAIGVEVVVHQILGLPGESVEQMVQTTRYIGASGAQGIKFHLLHVLEGTDLAALWRAGEVKVMEQEEYITALESCLRNLPAQVVVHRLTGDGAKRDLLAPLWSGEKKQVLQAIREAFIRDDLCQGSAQ